MVDSIFIIQVDFLFIFMVGILSVFFRFHYINTIINLFWKLTRFQFNLRIIFSLKYFLYLMICTFFEKVLNLFIFFIRRRRRITVAITGIIRWRSFLRLLHRNYFFIFLFNFLFRFFTWRAWWRLGIRRFT